MLAIRIGRAIRCRLEVLKKWVESGRHVDLAWRTDDACSVAFDESLATCTRNAPVRMRARTQTDQCPRHGLPHATDATCYANAMSVVSCPQIPPK
jgi:hypothetical protein